MAHAPGGQAGRYVRCHECASELCGMVCIWRGCCILNASAGLHAAAVSCSALSMALGCNLSRNLLPQISWLESLADPPAHLLPWVLGSSFLLHGLSASSGWASDTVPCCTYCGQACVSHCALCCWPWMLAAGRLAGARSGGSVCRHLPDQLRQDMRRSRHAAPRTRAAQRRQRAAAPAAAAGWLPADRPFCRSIDSAN